MSSSGSTARGWPGKVRGVPVRVLLGVLVLVSLSAAGWLSYREFDQAASSRRTVSHLEDVASDFVALAHFRARLTDEHNWIAFSGGLAEVGVPNDTMVALTGIDPEGELARAQSEVDASGSGPESIRNAHRELARVRASEMPLEERLDRYRDLESLLRLDHDVAARELSGLAGEVPSGRALAARVRQLGAAIDAGQAVASQLRSYYQAQFATEADFVTSVERLIDDKLRHHLATTALRLEIEAGSDGSIALVSMAQNPRVAEFEASTDALIDELVSTGASTRELTADRVAGEIDEILAVFESGARAADAHLAVVGASQRDLETATETLADSVSAQALRAVTAAAALGSVSLVLSAMLAWFIGAPLRNLAADAGRLRDGETSTLAPTGGPREVRLVDAAIREAAANLELARRQTVALARADLDDPILGQAVPGQVGDALQEAVQHLADSIVEREQYREQLAHEASHDGLTNLPNRSASLEHLRRGLARTARRGSSLALLFVDLDGFKAINDRHGHHAGDKVLRAVARRMVGAVREGDLVGRFGGDEFLVVAEPIDGPDEAVALARRLVDGVGRPIDAGGAQLAVSASVGIGLAGPGDDVDVDDLVRDADVAVYQAKAVGQGMVEVCDAELKAELTHRSELHDALVAAVAGDELTLHFQPIVEASTAEVCALEALVRWDRPGHGQVPPDAFIPFAERSGLIVDIDRWVADAAIAQLAAWERDTLFTGVSLAVNVSGRSLSVASFAREMLDGLERYGVEPSRLVVEITESALLEDVREIAARLELLRRHGVRVSIDDFGTGYTSLSSLRELPVDILKIDRTYTDGDRFESLVKLIIDTGHLLGARVVAEGIETSAQADRLAAMGSDELQGYLFGRPCSADQLARNLLEDGAMSARR